MASRRVRAWAWWCIIGLMAVAWSCFLFWSFPPDWFLLVGIGIVLFCLVRLYQALGNDELLPEASRLRLRRHVLMFGPVGALETLLVSFGHR